MQGCAKPPGQDKGAEKSTPRGALSEHLPRHEVTLDIGGDTCGGCGGALHAIGETVSEMSDWIPASLHVVRIHRPKYDYRACGGIHQAAAPERTIAKGLATPALRAQVLVAKYCDHALLYRQSQIFARMGVSLDRSTLAGGGGGACWWLEGLQERIAAHLLGSSKLFTDDPPCRYSILAAAGPGLAGCGSMSAMTGRGWLPIHRRPFTSSVPIARASGQPRICSFAGVLQVDGYQGFELLTNGGMIVLAVCWAHTRSKYYNVFEATGSPIAAEALNRIGRFYEIEKAANEGQLVCQARAQPFLSAMKSWLEHQHERVPGRCKLTDAICYTLNRWSALNRFVVSGPSRLRMSRLAEDMSPESRGPLLTMGRPPPALR